MDLTNKTIFDLCKDKKLIKKIIGGNFSKEYYNGFPETAKAAHLLELATKTNDKELYDAAIKNYNAAIDKFEQEQDKAMREGRIID